MGSHDFRDYGEGTDPRAIYDRLVQSALHEHGHDGYNGTISTTSGFRVVTTTPLTREEAEQLAEEQLDNFQKWEECGAIPIADGAFVGREVKLSIRLDNPGPVFWQDRERVDPLVRAEVAQRWPDKDLVSWDLEPPQQALVDGKWVNQGREVVYKHKAEVVAPKGKTKTRYFIVDVTRRHFFTPEHFLSDIFGYDTQAQARAAVTAIVKNGDAGPGGGMRAYNASGEVQLDVIGVTMREDGEPLVRGVRKPVQVTYPVIAKVGKVNRNAAIKGYLFFGWAAC